MTRGEKTILSQNGFARRRENKKRDIIAAARRLFFSSTPKNVTIAALAREANVSQVSIYNFFGSKENVIREVFFVYMTEAFEALQKVIDSDISFQEKIRLMFDMNMASAGEVSPEAYALMQWDDPLVKEFQHEYATKKALPQLFCLIDQGKREGQIDPGLDNETIILYLNTFGQIIATPGVAEKWDRHQREQINRLFHYGLFGKPPQ